MSPEFGRKACMTLVYAPQDGVGSVGGGASALAQPHRFWNIDSRGGPEATVGGFPVKIRPNSKPSPRPIIRSGSPPPISNASS